MKQEEFAAIIAGLESQGMTPTEIARESGLSRMTVWRIANGETSRPSYDTVIRLKSLAVRRTAVTDMLRR
ncbi:MULTISPECIES: helix-turn-helix domain-containing protein [Sinorhizobium]|uniref:HTH cro/C1-type domain-containing protein n=2 Tax=Sinorhizobium TaxID=28105 RepID=A0ABX4TNT8_9HYPH|nr:MULTISPECIES: helix-turn-helix domain-containing protein [Sinorhizobium]MDW9823493.1 helix-turn-helix domain-containing protein [Sinorhizobium meliloti]MDW9866360.1 helix-turn-helix domain-containing protein [Sinorhizobium meliloti]MDX0514878.1 helix-turn-helix domain-containing protein [Sinorhizobium medicae]MDX0567442.1 helix-turn-helix domain-containing protein [Sinorhizobium medicae]MDX0580098.1 helix-turn-helix domain-containing protein [Sinorhizobium medicae]